MGRVTCFKHGHILRNHVFEREDLWVRDGKIIDPQELFWAEKKEADIVIDCTGLYISPGFIDVQLNGAFGIDFSSVPDDPEQITKDLETVAHGLLAHGVTSFCPTIITSPPSVYPTIFPKIRARAGGKWGATVLGLHLEGPFISRDKSGAHPVEYIRGDMRNGMNEILSVYGSLQDVAIVTLAPELPGAAQVVEELVKKGIKVSMGHTACHLEAAEAAVGKGATMITHLFNAMAAFHHRDPGLVGLLSEASFKENPEVFYGLIVDGFHTHPAAMHIAYATHPKGCVLVTDAIAAMGLAPGIHHLGKVSVSLDEHHRCTVNGTETLAGRYDVIPPWEADHSAAPMDACVRRFEKIVANTKHAWSRVRKLLILNLPIPSSCARSSISRAAGVCGALDAATIRPAQALGISNRKGSLAVGCDADIVLLTKSLDVVSTYIAGECVYSA